MRIGITGAQSVGKTTLLNALRSESVFSNYAVCDEVTRRVNSYGIPINENGNDITQHLIMNEHIYNIFMYDDMLTDRTALDGLVYSNYLWNNNQISNITFEHVQRVFEKLWPMYDIVFYIEPEFDIVDDGVRSIDVDFRDEIAYMFEQTIEENDLKLYRVSGSVRNRVDTILNILENKNV